LAGHLRVRHAGSKVFFQSHGQFQGIDGIQTQAGGIEKSDLIGNFFRGHFQHEALDEDGFDTLLEFGIGEHKLVTMKEKSGANNPEKVRLDQLVFERGLAESREKAQRLIMAGAVELGGVVASKAGLKVRRDMVVSLKQEEKYVGRGGFKLEHALAHFGVSPAGKICLDVGASTGGFTDCLLQHGASRVHAVDVGHSQLHWRLRQDPRVVVYEGLNARLLQPGDLPPPLHLAVADVSFISLTLILPPVFALLEADAEFMVLIKPQFELARELVGRGGVVRDEEVQLSAVEKIRQFVESQTTWRWGGFTPSPIVGAKGNREFLAHLKSPQP
jgi:23S rRNA (cytidine1920-2'-O)/16S rRNA (cytidine1409-2'-O)-methyltransferase